MNGPWNNEDLRRAFDADFDALVAFASRSKARVGFAFLRADGQVDLGRPLDARISARMTHVFALAQMRGIEGTARLVDHGLAALAGPLRAPNGSWYAEVVPTSEHAATPVPRAVFSQRAQSAMIGAAAAAAMVGHGTARDLLADLEADQDQRWWDPRTGAVREEIEAQAGARSPLRRLSTNLDTAQAYLAAWEATGERVWFDRARSILRLVGEIAARSGFALPDLYDEEWRPLPASCDQAPVELIRPGDTLPGLGFKAARLIGQVYAILTYMGEKPGPWMIDTATALYDRALADGWTDEGVGGIVYTLDPTGVVAAPSACTGSCARPPAPPASSPRSWTPRAPRTSPSTTPAPSPGPTPTRAPAWAAGSTRSPPMAPSPCSCGRDAPTPSPPPACWHEAPPRSISQSPARQPPATPPKPARARPPDDP